MRKKCERLRSNSKYKNEFENIDTEIKAYFLGLMYADGCISKFNEGLYSKDYSIKISLHEEEKYILDRFKIEFPFLQRGSFDYSKYNKNCSIQEYVRYFGTFIYNDMLKHGLFPRKSYENKDLLKIPSTIPQNLMHHFIRGYFDGDGSINIASKRPNLRRIDMCSVSETFMKEIYNWFSENNCTPYILRAKNSKYSKQTLYVLEWIKSEDILKFKELIYKDSTIHFIRKKEKFDSFKIIDKTLKDFECIYCNSNNIISNGIRKMQKGLAKRFVCKKCNKHFTLYDLAPLKQEELLGTPTTETVNEDNQQPSLVSNNFEGSTTNSRILPSNVGDSNGNTSILPGTEGISFNIILKKEYFDNTSDDIV